MNGSIIWRSKDGATATLELQYSGEPKPRIYVQVPFRRRHMTWQLDTMEQLTASNINLGNHVVVTIRKQLKNKAELRMEIKGGRLDRKAVRQGAAVWVKILVENAFGEANTRAFTFQGRSKHR